MSYKIEKNVKKPREIEETLIIIDYFHHWLLLCINPAMYLETKTKQRNKTKNPS